MSAPGGFLPDVIIFVPVRFVPPNAKVQQAFQEYIPVRTGATQADIRAAAAQYLAQRLAQGFGVNSLPAANGKDYVIEILPITAIPRASSGQRGY